MDKKIYDLDFYQALKEMVEKGTWVKGETFVDGVYLKLNSSGKLVLVDVGRLSIEEDMPFIKSLSKQKYRIITVATMKNLIG